MSQSFSMGLSPFQGHRKYGDATATKSRPKEEEETSLESLHSKLQAEAEKMVRWKVSTEVTLHQKERQLNETQKVIKVLRSNVIEQQLNSEHLSQSLLREKNHREQIAEQVTVTRHMCDVLSSRQGELQSSVLEFQAVREQLQFAHDEAKEHIISLTAKIEKLTQKHRTTIQDLTSSAAEQIKSITLDKDLLKKSLHEKNDEIEELTNERELLKEVERLSSHKLFSLEEALEAVTARCHWTTHRLEQLKLASIELKKEMEKENFSLKVAISQVEQRLKEDNERLTESRSEFQEAAQKVVYLENYNATIEANKADLLHQLKLNSDQIKELEKTVLLTSQKYENLLERSSEKERTLSEEKELIEAQLLSCRKEVEEKVSENSIILKNFEDISEKIDIIKRQFEEDKKSLTEDLELRTDEKKAAEKKLQEMVDRLTLLKAEKENEASLNASLREEICNLQKTLTSSSEELKNTKDLLASLSEEFEKQSSKLNQATKELEQKVSENSVILKNFEEILDKIDIIKRQFEEDKKALTEDLELKSDEKKAVEKNLHEMSDQLTLLKAEKENEASLNASLREEICNLQKNLASSSEELKNTKDMLASTSEEFEKQSSKLNQATKLEESLRVSSDSQLEQVKNLQDLLHKEEEKSNTLKQEVESKSKALTCEQRKNEKLKNKVQTVESKLKEKDSKSKNDLKTFEKTITELTAKVDSLTLQKDKLETVMEETKKEKLKMEETLKQQLTETNENLNTAKENAEESERKKELAEREANSKIKEMMDLAESWKRESELSLEAKNEDIVNLTKEISNLEQSLSRSDELQKELENTKKELGDKVQKQDEELLTIRDNLTCKTNELNELKTAIKSLTDCDLNSRFKTTNSPLKTPSPRQYLSLCPTGEDAHSALLARGNSSAESSVTSGLINEATKHGRKQSIPLAPKPPRVTNHSILKQGSVKNSRTQPHKSVTFPSPLFYACDSDSSEGLAIEFTSDIDDRFDTIRRFSQTRQRWSNSKKAIPKANIHPILRTSVSPSQQQQRGVPQAEAEGSTPHPSKRVRYDRSSIRTYTSPKTIKKYATQKST